MRCKFREVSPDFGGENRELSPDETALTWKAKTTTVSWLKALDLPPSPPPPVKRIAKPGGKPMEITYRGKTYRSISKCAEDYNVSPSSMSRTLGLKKNK